MNIVMMQRICQIIAQTYAVSYGEVWSIYSKNGSIDETIKIVETL